MQSVAFNNLLSEINQLNFSERIALLQALLDITRRDIEGLKNTVHSDNEANILGFSLPEDITLSDIQAEIKAVRNEKN